MLHLPRVMFAAPSSGSGKTMITCGILQAFCERGLNPASFKCGPDYIDPMFHSRVIGTPSGNLDTFFTDEQVTRHLFAKNAKNAGISVLEGVMGIYDGLGGISWKASSYDLASVTDTPIILIVNARGMSLSVIPLIQGYLNYQTPSGKDRIRGVILNQTTKMTYLLLKEEIEKQTGVRLYGYVPRMEDAVIESRHLGLVTPGEISDLKERLTRLAAELEQSLDLDGILQLAQEAEDYEDEALTLPESVQVLLPETSKRAASTRIAVAQDEAFCFYYRDNLDLLQLLGAELVPFSPLHDTRLPECIGGLILGGGYPELYAKQLSENEPMRGAVREAIMGQNASPGLAGFSADAGGMPFLAECGGFMYLQESMEDMEAQAWPMCGCIAGKSYKTPKLGRFGYITLTTGCQDEKQQTEEQKNREAPDAAGLLRPSETIRAHEFHYFDSTNPGNDYIAQKPQGKRTWRCIHADGHSAAGYPHLYYWSDPAFAARFLARARNYSDAER
ncbi:MAG: cobyrinate a,c-diamide synthase [Clostridiales bacterium]|nr:cobyrinate a,c-diamide synthase [Clostridiales bacterium]